MANSSFDFGLRYSSIEGAQDAAKAADLSNFKITADQGEWMIIDMAPKAPKAPKAEGPKAAPKAAPKGKGKKGADKRIAAQGDLKAAPKAAEKDYGNFHRPLSARKWIGPWADYKAKAEKGLLPNMGGAKALPSEMLIYGLNSEDKPIFSANTHRPFDKRILQLAALIRAKDAKGLRQLEIKEISTTPNMLAKLRDLALHALSAKAEKGNGKAKAEGQGDNASPAS